MNQMQLRRERDVVFIALEKKSRNGVTVKDLMESIYVTGVTRYK